MKLVAEQTPQHGGIDAQGVLDSRMLPDPEFDTFWESIFVEEELKTRLLGQGLLNFVLRPELPLGAIPLHGIILLVGPPGTGKTTLAKGLASRVAASVSGMGEFRFIETEPHPSLVQHLDEVKRRFGSFSAGPLLRQRPAGH